jgi:hypothetical protein
METATFANRKLRLYFEKKATPFDSLAVRIGVRDGGAGGQMFNISRAKSGKSKSEKAKKPQVCWSNKGSRAIFA